MAQINVEVKGLSQVLAQMRADVAKLEKEIDNAVERRALLMVNETRERAPVLTGKLRNSIDIIPQETRPMSRTYGTNVEYAQRQEYEHKTKKGFFRNTVMKHEPLLQKDIQDVINKM